MDKSNMVLRRITLLATCCWALTACDPASQAWLTGASLVSLAHTEKTLGDHFNTWAFDRDCSTLRFTEGGEYCEQHPAEQTMAQEDPVYCYRNLGGVTCYREKDRSASQETTVNLSY